MTIAIEWCPVCGRDDRFQAFTGKAHFLRGKRCKGVPVRVVYEHPYVIPDDETDVRA